MCCAMLCKTKCSSTTCSGKAQVGCSSAAEGSGKCKWLLVQRHWSGLDALWWRRWQLLEWWRRWGLHQLLVEKVGTRSRRNGGSWQRTCAPPHSSSSKLQKYQIPIQNTKILQGSGKTTTTRMRPSKIQKYPNFDHQLMTVRTEATFG